MTEKYIDVVINETQKNNEVDNPSARDVAENQDNITSKQGTTTCIFM